MALDANNNPHVTWHNMTGDIICYNAYTGAGWSGLEQIATTSNASIEPRIAVKSGDNPHVVWVDNDGSDDLIYYIAKSGGAWSLPENISTASTMNTEPQITVDSDNRPHVTWRGLGLSCWIYHGAKYGLTWVFDTVSIAYWNPGHQQITVDANNHPHVTWDDDDGSTLQVYYSANTGGGWSPVKLSTTSTGSGSPQIALDSNNYPHVTWSGYDGSSVSRIYYSANTGGGWSPVILSTTSTANDSPQIAVDSNNHPHVTWRGSDGSTNRTYYSAGNTYTLNVSTTGSGSVAQAPSQPTYDHGTIVQLTASPAAGWHFVEWQGDLTGSDNPKNTTMDANRNVTAVFAINTYTLNVSTTGSGSVALSPNQATYEYGTVVQLTASPAPGWHFVEWQGDLTGGDNPKNITMDANRNGTAVFAKSSTFTRPTWYLAEGSTAWGYDCYTTIENPNNTAVTADVTYMVDTGAVSGGTITLPAESQMTVNPAGVLGAKDFSMRVSCNEGRTISVDRTMTWNAGAGGTATSPEAHCSVGVTAPATTWYLAEGSTAWGFECWLLIQNPNGTEASCDVTYMIEGEGPQTVNHKVGANSRATFNMASDIGNKDASIRMVSDVPVIPERAMYRNNRREGHDSIGTTQAATDYYLAEGATGYNVGYMNYVLIQNPQGSPTDVRVTYQTGAGQVAGPSFQMPANSRKTIRVNDQLPPNTDVSTRVHGSQPIIAERAMYWNNGTGEACHDSIGMDSPHTTFYLPDGQSSDGRETWTLVQNPNDTDVQVEICYLTPDGQGNVSKTETIPANSRRTFDMLAHSGIAGRAAIMVTCKTEGKKVMVERAMYWNGRGAGTDTIGGYGD